MAKRKSLLAVGGLDPSGHAGILADARAWERLGISYRVALTAVTIQSEKKFQRFESVSVRGFREQLDIAGPEIAGVKLGMLGSPALGEALLRWLNKNPRLTFLWDPVWRSSTGGALLEPSAWKGVLPKLLERADILTPNIPEAEWILGRKISGRKQAAEAALQLFAMGRRNKRAVLLKGGHLRGSSPQEKATDWLFDGKKLKELRAKRRPSSRRGTGCSFGAAMLAGCLQGRGIARAARFAKRYVLTHLLDAPAP